MTSAENSISKPQNLKIFWGRTPPDPPTRLVPSALAIMPLVTKNLATALGNAKKISCVTLKYHSNPGKEKETLFTNFRLSYTECTCFSPSAQ